VNGVFADEDMGITVVNVLKSDLQNLLRSNKPQLRVLFGDNGTGKSTHIQVFRQVLESQGEIPNLFLDLDLRHIAEKTEQGLWLEIFNKIHTAIQSRPDLVQLLQKYDERELRNFFHDTSISHNVKNFGQDAAEDYFYGESFRSIAKIQAFFNGLVDLLMEKKILTVIAIDEVQQIEKWGTPVFEAFLELFVSATYDKYMGFEGEARLYLILSFLLKETNAPNEKYAFLEQYSPGFVSRMKGREIILCNFTESEHKKALELCARVAGLTDEECNIFQRETKSDLIYWATRNNPREFGKYIYRVFKKLDFLKLTPAETRQVYEKEGRKYVQQLLSNKGFTNIFEEPTKVLGYNFDVYAEAHERTITTKYVFGEIKTTQVRSLKGDVEKFTQWITAVKTNSSYTREGNFYFFMSPYKPTDAVKEILMQHAIEWIQFKPPELIFEEEEKVKPSSKGLSSGSGKRRAASKGKISKPPTTKPLFKIDENSKLQDIKIAGLGPARLKQLEAEGIATIKDLREANTNELVQKVQKISLQMLLNWKGECEKLINP